MEGTGTAMAIGLDAVRRQLCLTSFKDFVRLAWPVVLPSSEFVPNWHLGVICDHLQAVSEGRIKNLLINIPPRHAKSVIVAVMWPAWVWGACNPGWQVLCGSYSQELTMRDSVRCRDLILSPWYQRIMRPTWQLASDQNVKHYFVNTAKGFRFSLSVGSQATGWGGDCVMVDDPLNVRDQWSKLAREEAIRWWDKTMSTRYNDAKRFSKVIVMQRLHMEDLAGHVLHQGGYEHLCLPSEFETANRSRTCIGWSDPRTTEGELLFPQLFAKRELDDQRKILGSGDYAGQFQQRPADAEGAIFKRKWFGYYQVSPGESRVQTITRLGIRAAIQYWDTAYEDGEENDYSACVTMGIGATSLFVLEVFREQMQFPDLKRVCRQQFDKWLPAGVYVEAKASGKSLVQELRRDTALPIIEVQVDRDKVSRAHAITPTVEAGRVLLPDSAAWVGDFVDELCTFPKATHDDMVDAFNGAAGIAIKWATPVPVVNLPSDRFSMAFEAHSHRDSMDG